MQTISLPDLAQRHLRTARTVSSGRSSETIHGGHTHPLRQTLIALADGRSLDDHESPVEASLQVLHGSVRLITATDNWDGKPGDYLVIPADRHKVTALEDAAVLLTVAMDLGHWPSAVSPVRSGRRAVGVELKLNSKGERPDPMAPWPDAGWTR